jgi:uncharacterized membrane protein YfcA
MTVIEFAAVVGAGAFAAGLLGSLTGLGGVVVIVPLLVLGLGVDLRYAAGASLVAVIATSSGAAATYVQEGYTNVRIGMFLEVATTVGAIGGASLAAVASGSAVAVVFGVLHDRRDGRGERRRLPAPRIHRPGSRHAGRPWGARRFGPGRTPTDPAAPDLRRLFAVVILALGIQMIYKGLTGSL